METIIASEKFFVVHLKGHINAANAADFQTQLTSAVSSSGNPAILVDMAQVDSLDSAGLMALVSALTLAQRLDRRFSLCCVSPSIRIIFELTQLDRVFEIFENPSALTVVAA